MVKGLHNPLDSSAATFKGLALKRPSRRGIEPDNAYVWIEELRNPEVAAGKLGESTSDDLHVLLRHRLLPQPDGFECLGLALEGAPPDQLLFAPFADQPHRLLDGRAALRAVRAEAPVHERPVTE